MMAPPGRSTRNGAADLGGAVRDRFAVLKL